MNVQETSWTTEIQSYRKQDVEKTRSGQKSTQTKTATCHCKPLMLDADQATIWRRERNSIATTARRSTSFAGLLGLLGLHHQKTNSRNQPSLRGQESILAKKHAQLTPVRVE